MSNLGFPSGETEKHLPYCLDMDMDRQSYGDARASHGQKFKTAKLAMLSGLEGWQTPSLRSITGTLVNHELMHTERGRKRFPSSVL